MGLFSKAAGAATEAVDEAIGGGGATSQEEYDEELADNIQMSFDNVKDALAKLRGRVADVESRVDDLDTWHEEHDANLRGSVGHG